MATLVRDGVRCGCDTRGNPSQLEADLTHLMARGYDAAELPLDNLQCILGGRIDPEALDRVVAACAPFAGSLAFSVHAPAVLDLRDRQDPDLHREILLSGVRVAAAIGARVLVVHYEAESGEPIIEAQYRYAIEVAADLAGRHGVLLGIENIEVERAERVPAFVAALHHPWVRMTYDAGHDYLAADHFGYDHLASAAICAPFTSHLHLTDNFGRFHPARWGDFALWRAFPYSDLITTGMGDLHLPAGRGTLPFAAIYPPFAASGFVGAVISEHHRARYGEMDSDVCAFLRALTAHAG